MPGLFMRAAAAIKRSHELTAATAALIESSAKQRQLWRLRQDVAVLRLNVCDAASSDGWLEPTTADALSQAWSMCDETMEMLRALLAA